MASSAGARRPPRDTRADGMRADERRAVAGLAGTLAVVAMLLSAWSVLGGPGAAHSVAGQTAVLALDPDQAPEHMLSLWLYWNPPDGAPAWAVLEAGAPWSAGAEMSWRRRVHRGWNQLIWPTLPPLDPGGRLTIRIVDGPPMTWALGDARLTERYGWSHLVPLRGLVVALGLVAVAAAVALARGFRGGAWRPGAWTLALAAIAAVGIALRLRTLISHGFWFDEILTAIGAQSLAWALYAPHVFGHPPVQYLAAWLTGHADGEALRVPFALAGAATVAAVGLLGRRLLGPATGLIAAALLAVSPFHIEISQLARPYAIFVLLTVLGLLALVEALDRGGVTAWLAWAALTAVSCYTHYLGFVTVLVYVAIAVTWIARARGRGGLHAVLAFGLWALLLLPWRPLLLRQAAQHVGTGVVAPGALADLLWGVVASHLVGPGPTGEVALGLAGAGLLFALWRRPRAGALTGLWLAAPLLVIWAAQPYHFLAGRHLAFLQPVLFLLVAHGIVAVGSAVRGAAEAGWTGTLRPWARWGAAAAASAVLLVVAGSSAAELGAYYRLREGPDWRTVAGLLDGLVSPGERVVARLGAAYPLRRYWNEGAVDEMDPTTLAVPRGRTPRARTWIVVLEHWDDGPALADWLRANATKVAEVGPSWSLPRVSIYSALTSGMPR